MARWRSWGRVIGVVGLLACGCAARVQLEERVVRDLARTEEAARRRGAYERARERLERVERGMPLAELEQAMGAVVAIEEVDGEPGPVSRRVIEGLLCRAERSATRQRWIFGYEDEFLVLTGFAIDLERASEEDPWQVRAVDRIPQDHCPDRAAS